MPDSALTPQRALEYLGGLSTDIRAAVLLDSDAALAAHTAPDAGRGARLGELALELFERADAAAARTGADAAQVEVSIPVGAVFAVREPQGEPVDGWTIAVVTPRFALSSLMFYDLRKVLSDLRPEAA